MRARFEAVALGAVPRRPRQQKSALLQSFTARAECHPAKPERLGVRVVGRQPRRSWVARAGHPQLARRAPSAGTAPHTRARSARQSASQTLSASFIDRSGEVGLLSGLDRPAAFTRDERAAARARRLHRTQLARQARGVQRARRRHDGRVVLLLDRRRAGRDGAARGAR